MKNVKEILKDTEVKVENLGEVLKEKGVIVDVSFGGGRNSYRVPLESFGVRGQQLSESSKEFFENHAKDGTIVLVPDSKHKDSEYKRLRRIEARTKKKLREISIGYNGRFVPIKDFEEFMVYFEDAKREYLEVRDDLVNDYSNLVGNFKETLASSLTDLNIESSQELYEEIVRKLPSKENFANSFRAELSVSLLPTVGEFSGYGFDEEIQEAISSQYEELGKNLIGDSTVSVLQEAIDSLSSVINGYNKTGKIHHKIKSSLKNCSIKMSRKNIFGNSRLDEIKTNIEELIKSDCDMVVQQSEMLLSEIYMYSKELGIDNKIDLTKTSLLPSDLESLYNLFN